MNAMTAISNTIPWCFGSTPAWPRCRSKSSKTRMSRPLLASKKTNGSLTPHFVTAKELYAYSRYRIASSNVEATNPLRAVEGDIVTLHWVCINENGEVLESSKASEEPTTFEVGAGDIVGNKLFEAFDEAVRGMAVGEAVAIAIQGGPWNQELMFTVPRSHEEIQSLEGRYKSQGGLQEGLIVQLSNGGVAVVVSTNETEVVLDANSMMAGKTLRFELELVDLERPSEN